jgi:hypothetical protein
MVDTLTYKLSTIHHSSPKFIAPFQQAQVVST